MKKYLMTAIAAVALGVAFVSCSHSEDLSGGDTPTPKPDPVSEQKAVELAKSEYANLFEQKFGGKVGIGKNVDWGFGSSAATRTFTRANAVISGDPFTFEETSGYYKTAVPDGVKTADAIITECKAAGWFDENKLQNYTDFELTNGTYGFHLWTGSRNFYVSGNDVTLDVKGNNSINQARIYLLPNTKLTLNMNAYINDLEIYVASNAILNYNYEMLYKQTGGGKIYSMGTINFPENFQVNQDAIVYNEGTVNGKNITSAPGDGHPSFFYNYGTLSLSGNLQLNSCANFFNEGTVTVRGLTECTQGKSKIWWINKGKFTTKKFKIQAWNGTYYNYCHLIVQEDAILHDGQMNLMDNSYMEAATADCNNFSVNMGGNSGFNVNGNNSWGAQGDGTYQGFKATGSNAYVRLGGTTTVAEHKKSLEFTGNITYAINNINDLGASNAGVQPTYAFNNGTIEKPFDKVSVTPNTNDCGATWIIDGDDPVTYRVIAEDLNANEKGSDWDFNDVVFDVIPDENPQNGYTIRLLAAGGIYKLTVAGEEVHAKFGHGDYENGKYPMINTRTNGSITVETLPEWHVSSAFNGVSTVNAIEVRVYKPEYETLGAKLEAPTGMAASKVLVDNTYNYLDERTDILTVYPNFEPYVQGTFVGSRPGQKWWQN